MSKHTILSRKKVYENFFVVEEIVCKSSDSSGTFKRFVLDRPDSAAILLHDHITNEVILVRQFRAPAIDKDVPEMLEIPAGVVEFTETPLQCIKRESLEEAGYNPINPRHLFTYYPSPGVSSERIHIYFANIDVQNPQSDGGGVPIENEYISVEKYTLTNAMDMITSGEIKDGKTIAALQWAWNDVKKR